MESTNPTEGVTQKSLMCQDLHPQREGSETFAESPISPAAMEVIKSNDQGEKGVQDALKPAQSGMLESLNIPKVPVESSDSSSEIQEKFPPCLIGHQEEMKTPVDRNVPSPEMLSHLEPAQALENSMEDKANLAMPTNKVETNNMSDNVPTSVSTMLTAEMESKEDKMNNQENAAFTSKKEAESETRSESPYRGLVDTAAPFESVREAVSKFGGIVDWKAHKAQTLERRRLIQLELEKVQQDIPQFKEDSEAAEMAKSQVVEELESTKRLIEELKHSLERAQIEVEQAKQDSELAQLRAQETEQGIADEASVIVQTQLAVAKERHEKAAAELKLVKEELRSMHEKYVILASERDIVMKRAEEVASAERETEKRLEELTLELIASKESLELAHAAHHEAEEHRLGAALVKEQDCLAWEKELRQAREELQQLNEQLQSKSDVKSKLDANLRKLLSLNTELMAYMGYKLSEEAEGVVEEHSSDEAKEISRSIKEALASTRSELELVKGDVEKAKKEAHVLRVAAESLRSELDNEKASLITLQQREGMASIAVSSLEAELNRTKHEIELVHSREAETREKMVELPKLLQQAAQEAEDAKVAAQLAQEAVRKAKEEAEQTKAAATTAEIRLRAVLKEMEASKASERLALVAVQALQESEEARSVEDSRRGVTLPISEYYALSKRVHEAEEHASGRVTAALAQVELAKESESKSLERLNEASKVMDQKKEALEIALERAERAKEGKLGAEQELRKWRAEHEQRRKAHKAAKHAVSVEHKGPYQEDKQVLAEPKLHVSSSTHDDIVLDRKSRKKKSFLPQMSTLLSRKTQTQT